MTRSMQKLPSRFVRWLSNYDAAFNRQDAVTIAGLYTENAVFNTPEGTFHGAQSSSSNKVIDRADQLLR